MKGKEGDRMKVIFLDIDGVLYPCRKRISPYTTFRFDREQLGNRRNPLRTFLASVPWK